jgi:ATP-dependent HslUV protease ATP-binding subunit HslU
VRAKLVERKKAEIALKVEEKILDQLVGENSTTNRDSFRALLRQGLLDTRTIDVDVPEPRRPSPLDSSGAGGNNQPMNEIILRFDKLLQQGGRRAERRQMTIAESRPVLEEVYSEKVISEEEVKRAALHAVEEEGIVFIDEIDKICSRGDYRGSADASSEGVQRDLLPLIEGSTVSTKHGNINTDHILFVCSGAFHQCRPSDLLAELQGRLPIRVELKQLTEHDLYRILTEPETSLIQQQVALMATEAVTLSFSDDALRRVAHIAAQVNREVENIGARRLNTIIER